MITEHERIIRLWFEMWLQQKDLGIDNIFTEDVIYTESWGPQYTDRAAVRHWFHEWTPDNRIQSLKEFGCNLNNYDPYANGKTPVFRDEPVGWF